VLRGDGTLISKMSSVAFLHTDMILLADLIPAQMPGADLMAAGLLRLRSHRFNLFGRIALPIFIEARANDYI
jgi:hypothetical protein